MTKITLTDLVNLQNENTAVSAINNNNTTLENAFDNTLSRNGQSPNQMLSTLDMNSNRIINLPIPEGNTEPLRKGDLSDFEQFQNSVNLAAALAQADADAAAAAAAANTAVAAANSIFQLNSIFQYLPSGEIPLIQNGTSTFDCGPAFQTALNALNGKPLYVPTGVYQVNTPVTYVGVANPFMSTVTLPGAKIYGEGPTKSIIRNNVTGIHCTNCFSMTNGSSLVNVRVPGHGLRVNQVAVFTWVDGIEAGLDMEGPFRVAGVVDADNIQVYHLYPATSTVNLVGNCWMSVPMFTFDPSSDKFQEGTEIKGLGMLSTYLSKNGNCAVRTRGQLHFLMEDVWINTHDTGFQCYAVTGDIPAIGTEIDSSSFIELNHVRIDNSARWGAEMYGISENVGGTVYGHNEISNTVFNSVWFNENGYGQASDLHYGGALKWKGQGLHLGNTAFTANRNVSILVPMQAGASGTPSGITADFLVFENTWGTAAMYVEGLLSANIGHVEFYQNEDFTATYGLYMTAQNNVIYNVNVGAGILRVKPESSPYTGYALSGALADPTVIRILTPVLQVFGAPGQTVATGLTLRT